MPLVYSPSVNVVNANPPTPIGTAFVMKGWRCGMGVDGRGSDAAIAIPPA
jgi:hypothetical protein